MFLKIGVVAKLGSVFVRLKMKDSCFIRTRSGLSSQELGASSHLKLRSSIALQNQWHRTRMLKPLFPLQLFCRAVVVGRLVEPEDLDKFEFNIRNDAQLNLMNFLSPSSSPPPFKLPAFLDAHSGLVDCPGRCSVALMKLHGAAGGIIVLKKLRSRTWSLQVHLQADGQINKQKQA